MGLCKATAHIMFYWTGAGQNEIIIKKKDVLAEEKLDTFVLY